MKYCQARDAMPAHSAPFDLCRQCRLCQTGCMCSQTLGVSTQFYGLFKLLFPSFNPPYVQILALTTSQFTNHTTQEQQDNSFYCKSKYRLATAMSTRTLPHRIDPRSLLPQEKYLQLRPKPRGVPPLHPDR